METVYIERDIQVGTETPADTNKVWLKNDLEDKNMFGAAPRVILEGVDISSIVPKQKGALEGYNITDKFDLNYIKFDEEEEHWLPVNMEGKLNVEFHEDHLELIIPDEYTVEYDTENSRVVLDLSDNFTVTAENSTVRIDGGIR